MKNTRMHAQRGTRAAAPATATVIIAMMLVTGCGGGGGSSEPPASRSSVTITAANRDTVATAAMNATLGAGLASVAVPLGNADRAAAAAASVTTTRISDAVSRLRGSPVIAFALDAAFAPLGSRGSLKTALAARPQGTITQSQPCAGGGSVTLTLNDADNNQVASSGDSVSIAFSQCRSAAGEQVNGSISVSYSMATVTPTRTDVAASMAFSNLSAVTPEGSTAVNGSLSLAGSQQGAVTTAQLSVSGALTVSATTPTYTDSVTLSGGLTLALIVDEAAVPPGGGAPGATTVRIDGVISSTRLAGGTIELRTVVPLREYDADPYPRQGQIVVVGAAGSQLRLTALSTATLRLELDANGDGAYESIVDQPWVDVI